MKLNDPTKSGIARQRCSDCGKVTFWNLGTERANLELCNDCYRPDRFLRSEHKVTKPIGRGLPIRSREMQLNTHVEYNGDYTHM